MSSAHLTPRSPRDRPALAEPAATRPDTVADLLRRLGGVPAHRVRLVPTPGTATEDDLVTYNESADRRSVCELVEGTLVEKPVGYEESEVAVLIIRAVANVVYPRKLGRVLGEGGMLRLFPGLIRVPDVSFLSYARFPRKNPPKGAIAPVTADLAVEVLSKSNTKKEMERKRLEYFGAGTRIVWMIDPKKKVARVYTSPTEFTSLSIDDTLDGGDVLPGSRIPIRDLFPLD